MHVFFAGRITRRYDRGVLRAEILAGVWSFVAALRQVWALIRSKLVTGVVRVPSKKYERFDSIPYQRE